MRDNHSLSPSDAALMAVMKRLEAAGYDFVTPTPLTHARVLARDGDRPSGDLRDILGWSRPIDPAAAPRWLAEALAAAGLLREDGEGRVRSAVRVSRLQGRLLMHSAYPTDAPDAVFLGPDSYRFAELVARELDARETGLVVDLGGGCGAGALAAATAAPAARLQLLDVNPLALRLARVNVAHAGAAVDIIRSDGLEGLAEAPDVVLANPPYMAGSDQVYRDGGGLHGGRLSLDWAKQALDRLAPGGRLILYTGAAILKGGWDPLRQGLAEVAAAAGARMRYAELDPDVFGEELDKPAYADVERIAAVACVMTKAA